MSVEQVRHGCPHVRCRQYRLRFRYCVRLTGPYAGISPFSPNRLRNLAVIEMRGEGHTYAAIGRAFGISGVRVQQIVTGQPRCYAAPRVGEGKVPALRQLAVPFEFVVSVPPVH